MLTQKNPELQPQSQSNVDIRTEIVKDILYEYEHSTSYENLKDIFTRFFKKDTQGINTQYITIYINKIIDDYIETGDKIKQNPTDIRNLIFTKNLDRELTDKRDNTINLEERDEIQSKINDFVNLIEYIRTKLEQNKTELLQQNKPKGLFKGWFGGKKKSKKTKTKKTKSKPKRHRKTRR